MLASQLSFETDGAEIISGAVSLSDVDTILPAFGTSGHRPGARSLLLPQVIRDMVGEDGPMGRLAQRFCAPSDGPMRPVRVLLFDKTAETNWMVPWHQDRTIAVAERHDVAGFSSWNVKDGVTHVEPPIDLLARMVTLRLHLDETGPENGALDIVPGSHKAGRLPAADVVRLGRESSYVRCAAGVGDVLAMRLLTVHKSERATLVSRRRVLHVDYSADVLPEPLAWHARVQ